MNTSSLAMLKKCLLQTMRNLFMRYSICQYTVCIRSLVPLQRYEQCLDASAKTLTGISLNETLLVGPTVHSTLIDVLLRFRLHRVALTADVSRMYRAIALTDTDKDLHRFVWRDSPHDPLRDF